MPVLPVPPVPMVAGNWKMNTSIEEARTLALEIRSSMGPASPIEVVVCPPFVSLEAVRQALGGSPVKLGAQNMHQSEKGAYTGEVSPMMLAGICQYVILGHSERRQHFGETNEVINLKIKAALAIGLRPILCVGETLEQRQEGAADTVVSAQVKDCLTEVDNVETITVAYEPVWAIGTGVAATPEIAGEIMGGTIRGTLSDLYGREAAGQVPLLYGGSVNPENAAQFAAIESVHGSLVGGASLRTDQFMEIVRTTAQVKGV